MLLVRIAVELSTIGDRNPISLAILGQRITAGKVLASQLDLPAAQTPRKLTSVFMPICSAFPDNSGILYSSLRHAVVAKRVFNSSNPCVLQP